MTALERLDRKVERLLSVLCSPTLKTPREDALILFRCRSFLFDQRCGDDCTTGQPADGRQLCAQVDMLAIFGCPGYAVGVVFGAHDTC